MIDAVAGELGLRGVRHREALQALVQVAFGRLPKRAVQCVTGKGEERDEPEAGRKQLSRLQRTRAPALQRAALTRHSRAPD